MPATYVLIDFENVQPKELGAFGGGRFKVIVFVGHGQTSVPIGLARALQALGGAGSYVQIEGRGPNALDMHIAYYIGKLAGDEPGAAFHVVSRDRDYDPLIRHLKTQGITCARWKTVAEIGAEHPPAPAAPRANAAKPARKASAKPAPKAPVKTAVKLLKVPPSRIDEVIVNLRKRGSSRPSTKAALASTIKAHYRGGVTDKEVAVLVAELELRGVIALDGGKVTYQL
jgi:hypothetical protein